MKIHLIEPFFSGSHKLWGDQIVRFSRHSVDLVSLPGRHWKWRMQSAAPVLAERSNRLSQPELYLVTDMLNLAEFRSFLLPERRKIPIILYMHENQITYPWSPGDDDVSLQRDHTYGMINVKSCIAADAIIFNSEYHQTDFLNSLPDFLGKFPEHDLHPFIEGLFKKTNVIPVGVNFPIGVKDDRTPHDPPVILWNHRWEYDKGPDEFFQILYTLKEKGLNFRLIACGERGREVPVCFHEARENLHNEIIHWGFVESREEYLSLVQSSDVLPVTNHQDFFGISIIEAIANGIYPILPARLSYPEHIPESLKGQHLYHSREELVFKLADFLRSPAIPDRSLFEHIQKYRLEKVILEYDSYFEKIK